MRLHDVNGFELLGSNYVLVRTESNNAVLSNYYAENKGNIKGSSITSNRQFSPGNLFYRGYNVSDLRFNNVINANDDLTQFRGAEFIYDINGNWIHPYANDWAQGHFFRFYSTTSPGYIIINIVTDSTYSAIRYYNNTTNVASSVILDSNDMSKSNNFVDTVYVRMMVSSSADNNDKLIIKYGRSIDPSKVLVGEVDMPWKNAYIDWARVDGSWKDNTTVYKFDESDISYFNTGSSWDFNKQIIEIPLNFTSTVTTGSRRNVEPYTSSAVIDWTNEMGSSSSIDISNSLTDGLLSTYAIVGNDTLGLQMVGNAYDIGSSSYADPSVSSETPFIPENVVGIKYGIHRIIDDDGEPITMTISSSHLSQAYSQSVSASVSHTALQSIFIDMTGLTGSMENPVTASLFTDFKAYFRKDN